MPPPSFTISLLPPPGKNLTLPTRTIPYPATNHPIFNDALAVRLQVFVDEQKCQPDFEIDDNDPRSWHWVIYDEAYQSPLEDPSSPSRSSRIKVPVAVVRLVPPPHAVHGHGYESESGTGTGEGQGQGQEREEKKEKEEEEQTQSVPKYDLAHEPYIKFGRVAVLPSYRGCGLARRLMETAMGWAAENAAEINAALAGVIREERGEAGDFVWRGLSLVHAQVQVEKLYERVGFVTDEDLGRWIEEGIEHVGMWRRLGVKG